MRDGQEDVIDVRDLGEVLIICFKVLDQHLQDVSNELIQSILVEVQFLFLVRIYGVDVPSQCGEHINNEICLTLLLSRYDIIEEW